MYQTNDYDFTLFRWDRHIFLAVNMSLSELLVSVTYVAWVRWKGNVYCCKSWLLSTINHWVNVDNKAKSSMGIDISQDALCRESGPQKHVCSGGDSQSTWLLIVHTIYIQLILVLKSLHSPSPTVLVEPH